MLGLVWGFNFTFEFGVLGTKTTAIVRKRGKKRWGDVLRLVLEADVRRSSGVFFFVLSVRWQALTKNSRLVFCASLALRGVLCWYYAVCSARRLIVLHNWPTFFVSSSAAPLCVYARLCFVVVRCAMM